MEHTCFVHIGAPKTGSTFLQKALASNQAALLDAGLLYPPSTLRGFGHHDIAFLLGGGYPEWATPQPKPLGQLLAETTEDIAGHDGDVLFSSEDFFLFPDPARLKEFLAASGALQGRRPRIVVYARRQDEAIEAWYNQVQGGPQPTDGCLGVRRGPINQSDEPDLQSSWKVRPCMKQSFSTSRRCSLGAAEPFWI